MKGLIPGKYLTWTTPRAAQPGSVVLVHMLWTPHPGNGNTWTEPPAEPGDRFYGFWAPVPRVFLGVRDFVWDHCCRMVPGIVNLFQEDPKACLIEVDGLNWACPWDGLYQIALITPEIQNMLDKLEAEDAPTEGS